MLVSKGNTEYMSGSRNKEVSPSEAHGNYESQKKKKKIHPAQEFFNHYPYYIFVSQSISYFFHMRIKALAKFRNGKSIQSANVNGCHNHPRL
jgi:hypothetical protein